MTPYRESARGAPVITEVRRWLPSPIAVLAIFASGLLAGSVAARELWVLPADSPAANTANVDLAPTPRPAQFGGAEYATEMTIGPGETTFARYPAKPLGRYALWLTLRATDGSYVAAQGSFQLDAAGLPYTCERTSASGAAVSCYLFLSFDTWERWGDASTHSAYTTSAVLLGPHTRVRVDVADDLLSFVVDAPAGHGSWAMSSRISEVDGD